MGVSFNPKSTAPPVGIGSTAPSALKKVIEIKEEEDYPQLIQENVELGL